MDELYKCNDDRKTNVRKHVLYDPLYVKFKIR